MKFTHLGFLALGLVLLVACSTGTATPLPSHIPLPTVPTRTPPPTATVIAEDTQDPEKEVSFGALPLPVDRNEYFSGSGPCVICHQDMQDESSQDVSIDSMWRSTMMANAARDPYWHASVRAEILQNPGLSEAIQDKCANCHMPMAWFTLNVNQENVEVLDGGLLNPSQELHSLAMDGVSCTLCHQIQEEGLGFADSYSGGFGIDLETPEGERSIYGPYIVDDAGSLIMQSVSGYIPVQSNHVADSELCATCHTLYTSTVDVDGNILGEFPEQVPYFEWFYSAYRKSQSCQDCHMPEAQGGVRISNTDDILRNPFYQHLFVGGNVYMLEIFQEFGDELQVTASQDQFAETQARTLDQLQNLTATLELEEPTLSGGRLRFELILEALTGHKFPTGYPSRRAWIHVKVLDVNGEVVFESGGVNPDGLIIGNNNDEDPTQFEPHYIEIVQPSQVQIYETILLDSNGNVTTGLMRAAQYAKDNRLLPEGFMFDVPLEEIKVKGRAVDDPDFSGGSDRIQYAFDLAESNGPYTLLAELLYQPIGFRWADNLGAHPSEEVNRFKSYYENVPNEPVIIDSISVELGE